MEHLHIGLLIMVLTKEVEVFVKYLKRDRDCLTYPGNRVNIEFVQHKITLTLVNVNLNE